MDLFNKEKEEQELENKEFDTERGIEINFNGDNFKLNELSVKSRSVKNFKKVHKENIEDSTFFALEHGVIYEKEEVYFVEDVDEVDDVEEFTLEELQSFIEKLA